MISAWTNLVSALGEFAGQGRINGANIEFRASDVRGTPPSVVIDNETRRMDPFYGTGRHGDHLNSVAGGAFDVLVPMLFVAALNLRK